MKYKLTATDMDSDLEGPAIKEILEFLQPRLSADDYPLAYDMVFNVNRTSYRDGRAGAKKQILMALGVIDLDINPNNEEDLAVPITIHPRYPRKPGIFEETEEE